MTGERDARAAALREAADWLDLPERFGGPRDVTTDGTRCPDSPEAVAGVTWAAASLRDRAASLEPPR